MAAPKHETDSFPDDFWVLPADGTPNVLDDRRLALLRRAPGVVVHRRTEHSTERIEPIKMVGYISVEELRHLLGREPDDDVDRESDGRATT